MVRELLEVGLLLPKLLLESHELLLLALADGVILLGALAALEGVTVFSWRVSLNFQLLFLKPLE